MQVEKIKLNISPFAIDLDYIGIFLLNLWIFRKTLLKERISFVFYMKPFYTKASAIFTFLCVRKRKTFKRSIFEPGDLVVFTSFKWKRLAVLYCIALFYSFATSSNHPYAPLPPPLQFNPIPFRPVGSCNFKTFAFIHTVGNVKWNGIKREE